LIFCPSLLTPLGFNGPVIRKALAAGQVLFAGLLMFDTAQQLTKQD